MPDLTSLTPVLVADLTSALDQRLAAADAELVARFPGERPGRQPVHTVYVPADVMERNLASQWGEAARRHLREHAGIFDEVAGPGQVERVDAKLELEPIEDLRIDFEDGYGARGDEVEDGHVVSAATELAAAQRAGLAPGLHGIRFKSFEAPTRSRGLGTLALFVSTLLDAGGSLDRFVVTLPKVTSVDQVEAMVHTCATLESGWGLNGRALRFEIQVETPQSILGPDGTALVSRMIHAGDGRVTALHYGTYDYSAFCGIAAQFQSMEHPVADHAKLVMQAAAAGTGVRLSDGSTNVLPIGSPEAIRDGWRLHHRLVSRHLERGYYQGWDLHPSQLPTRYAATFSFYRNGFDRAAERLSNYLAAVGGDVMDEPATARALSDFIVRGLDCGALRADEVQGATGQSAEALVALARPTRH